MTTIQVSLLGRFAIEVNGETVEIRARASQSLFAYLALHRDTPLRRELLAGQFWPNTDETNARNNLRYALWQIRAALGQDVFVSDRVTVMIDPEMGWWVDADQLSGDPYASLDGMLEAAAFYRGDLLPGFYDDWVILAREQLRSAYTQLMERLLEGLIEAKRWPEVSEWAERWIALGHVSEPAFRALMTSHAARGDKAGVASVYQRCIDTLARELGVEPSSQTRLLHEQLKEGRFPVVPTRERYELGDEIGRGGMGEVYRAVDTWLERDVAVKVLSSDALGADARERLLAEAQSAARLNHPNVVSVYDIGEMDGQPFIVMELVEGKTLHEKRPESLTEQLAIVLEICAALEHAHAQGIVHRDIKPENVMLAPDGMARLMDFGLASRTIEAPGASEGGTAGTVYYMAPEVLQGGSATPQSDLYALGVLIYELLAGQLPFMGDDPMAVIKQHLEAEPQPPSRLNPDIRPALEALILRLLSKQPADRPLNAAAVAEVLEAVAPEEVHLGEPTPGEAPFKGLEYYDVDDAEIFFGREALVERLIDRLRDERFLAVIVGASGSGKSSIARAGLVPALRDGEWIFRLMTPTEHPLDALAETLIPDKEGESKTTPTPDDLARDPTNLHQAAEWLVETEGAERLLLVVDQLEEVFTLCDDEEQRAAFIDNLLTAADPEVAGPTVVVITLRADFYPHCAAYPALREALARNQEYIGPMNTSELRRAIEEPALRGGWKFQSGLVDLMLRDVRGEPGALPLLSHALLETWKRRSRRTLTLRGYAEAGGVRRAIARSAEQVYHQELSEEQRGIARNVFLRLTELGEGTEDTRRRVARTELVPDPGQNGRTEKVIATLAKARLITLSEEHVEVAHEALIREWPRLRAWLDEDREGLRIHRHLTEAAQAWEALERDPGELYRSGRLIQAMEWNEEQRPELNPLEREFLNASQALAEQREAEREAQVKRLRRRAIYLAGALIAAVVLAFAALSFGRQASDSAARADLSLSTAQAANTQVAAEVITRATAEAVAIEERKIAEAERQTALEERQIAYSRELAAFAINSLDIDPERSILIALEAISTAHTIEAETALHHSILAFRLKQSLGQAGTTGQAWCVDFHPDGRLLASGDIKGNIALWDTVLGRELLTLKGHEEWINDISFSPDGKLLFSASDDGTAKVWDVIVTSSPDMETLQIELNEKEGLTLHHDGWVINVDFNQDNMLIATTSVDGIARVWDANTGQELISLAYDNEKFYRVEFSPIGMYLATGSNNGNIRIWNVETSREEYSLLSYSYVLEIEFSPDGSLLASAHPDFVKIWDLSPLRSQDLLAAKTTEFDKALFTLTNHRLAVYTIGFSPDGTRLATGGEDGTAKIWDPKTGVELFSLTGVAGAVLGLDISPKCVGLPEYPFEWCGPQLATAHMNGTLSLWDISPTGSSELLTVPGYYTWFNEDGTQLSTLNHFYEGTPVIQTWQVPIVTKDGEILSPDGEDGRPGIELNNVKFPIFEEYIVNGNTNHDDTLTAVIYSDNTIRIFENSTGEILQTISVESHTGQITWVAFSPDGAQLATCSEDGTSKIIELDTESELYTLEPNTGALNLIDYSNDGSRFITGGYEGTVKLWDTTTWEVVWSVHAHDSMVWAGRFSPDDSMIATAGTDPRVKLWDVLTGQLLLTLTGHTAQSVWISFSPDGKIVSTSSFDGTAKLWEVSTGQELLTLPGDALNNVQFSPDGTRLAVSDYGERVVRVYVLPIDELVALAKARVTRSLTIDECKVYLHMEECPAE
ncbi:MAG: hypothetical protein AMJ88_11890 [Anaerolineae bacterium SM23_ 63]|nr:MAG: hypothetical protein AMJ88_11890 [Anaerolineae bacterium SM23_ 63]